MNPLFIAINDNDYVNLNNIVYVGVDRDHKEIVRIKLVDVNSRVYYIGNKERIAKFKSELNELTGLILEV